VCSRNCVVCSKGVLCVLRSVFVCSKRCVVCSKELCCVF
jgi:hypothetical protein